MRALWAVLCLKKGFQTSHSPQENPSDWASTVNLGLRATRLPRDRQLRVSSLKKTEMFRTSPAVVFRENDGEIPLQTDQKPGAPPTVVSSITVDIPVADGCSDGAGPCSISVSTSDK